MSDSKPLSTDDQIEVNRLRAENARLQRTIDHIDPHGPSPDYAPLVAENARQAETITRLREVLVEAQYRLVRNCMSCSAGDAYDVIDEALKETGK